jgi:translocation protein SEC62
LLTLPKENRKIDPSAVNFISFTVRLKRSKTIAIVLVILALCICLFPIWPYLVKLYVFYLSFYLLTFILFFSLVRLIIYFVCRLFGYEFWILPEIFENVN